MTSVLVHYCKEEGMPIVIYQFILLFAAPGLLMMMCYTYVIRELWRSTQNISLLTNAKRYEMNLSNDQCILRGIKILKGV